MKLRPKNLSILLAACGVALCATAAPSSAASGSGSGCSGEIAQFRAVIDSDARTGHVNASVYKRMAAEVERAAATCAAGREAAALSALSATRRRFGYP